MVDALGASSPLHGALRDPGRLRSLPFGAVWGTVPWVDEGFDNAALMQRYEQASVMIGVLPIGRQHAGGPRARGVLLVAEMAGASALLDGGLRGVAGAGGIAVARRRRRISMRWEASTR